ncbi:hypothetical protein GCM10010344_52330 [Streptomyces bluensis]|nr:hypothetical protein GCM10010344_52330 [Streptomyces bluensis]
MKTAIKTTAPPKAPDQTNGVATGSGTARPPLPIRTHSTTATLPSLTATSPRGGTADRPAAATRSSGKRIVPSHSPGAPPPAHLTPVRV